MALMALMVLIILSASTLAPIPAAVAAGAAPPSVDGGPDLALDPLAITEEMKAFAEEKVGLGGSRRSRLLGLQDALFDQKDGLGVTYGSAITHTAEGTFEARSGNCLSFTLLFASLARHLNLQTYFVEVDEVTGWSQRGEVGLNHWHMYAEVELDSSSVPVDFLPWTETRYRSSRRISDQRVWAHYHNNVGADFITSDNAPAALLQFERALELDPSFHPARINKAVAHRRNGEPEEAERLLLLVLDAEPKNAVAAANLATLYVETGRQTEAKKWLERRQAFLSGNPFHHFRLGMRAVEQSEFAQARDHFKRAISLQGDEGVFFEQLAKAQFRLGETRKARSSLRRALHFTESLDRRRLIEGRLNSMSPSAKKSS